MLDYDPTAAGSLRDVTRRFPALARKNAKDALHIAGRRAAPPRRDARRRGAPTSPTSTCWAAGARCGPYLARARKRGDLRTRSGKAPRSFERKLLAFLHKQGYR